ncbi:MAG: DUF2242 domain-containing protein [Vitreoscilla sp.]|nr:DUF2242 domain-containing protein [Burkholderiales bacterium]MBP6338954.1 DUF2242 domain-containing protein [Vitreoscilla sp.]MBP6676528.1 DUF2242 domain-containing protein [Vitreoscilla sp.]
MDRSTQPRDAARRLWHPLTVAALACLTLAGCFATPAKKVTVYQNESFESDETFSRLFDASPAAACEAARRALLGQGYLMSKVTVDAISATKSFQPEGDVHVQIVFNVVCVPEGKAAKVATAYVNAIQDRYALKKTSNSASLGVSALGSVSIPLSSNDDSLVKVASETIPAGQFYDRFFTLMQRNLDEQVKED